MARHLPDSSTENHAWQGAPESGELVFLGTGTSVGVPSVGCACDVCTSSDVKNYRTRCALAVGLPEGTLLIDTPPDLRSQLVREQIGIVHAVLYTHEHADHLFGLDDLRIMQFHLGHPVPIYCEERVEDRIRRSFDYAFSNRDHTHPGAVPQLVFHRITAQPFELLGTRIVPVRLLHGPRFRVLGFRVGNVAYCTDTNDIPAESLELLQDLDILILDALRHRPHPTHFSLEEAMDIAERLQAGHTYFTHICHELDHATTNEQLPANMELAYDGLRWSWS